MMNILNGWKVVRHAKGRDVHITFLSSIADTVYAEVIYPIDEWVEHLSSCGPLAVFTTPEGAIEFMRIIWSEGSEYELHECEYEPSDDETLWCFGNCGGGPTKKITSGIVGLFDDVGFADRVKLGKKISISTEGWVGDE